MTRRLADTASVCLLTALSVFPISSAFGQKSESVGEFGAVDARIGTVRNSGAVFVGGRGGWILDGRYAIGIGGYLLVNNVPARIPDTSGNRGLMASYGGLDLEYLYPLDESFQVTAQMLVGGGAIGHVEDPYVNPRQRYSPFFVLEPGFNIDVGIGGIFRVGAGASYRFVGWLSSAVTTGADMSGPLFNFSIKAGFF